MALINLVNIAEALALLLIIVSFATLLYTFVSHQNIVYSISAAAAIIIFGFVWVFAFWYGETHAFIQPTELAMIHHTTANPDLGEETLENVVGNDGEFRSGIIQIGFFDEVLLFDRTVQTTTFLRSTIDANSPYRVITVRDTQSLDIGLDIRLLWRLNPANISNLYLNHETEQRMALHIAQVVRSTLREDFEQLRIATTDLIGEDLEVPEDGEEASGARERIRASFESKLTEELGAQGFIIEGVYLGVIDLDDTVEAAILSKVTAQFNQEAQEEINEEQRIAAEGQAEIIRINAQGQANADAEARQINAASNAEAQRIAAQADADAQLIRAQGEASSIEAIAIAEAGRIAGIINSYGGVDAYINALGIESLGDNVELVITSDGTIPVLHYGDSSASAIAIPVDTSN